MCGIGIDALLGGADEMDRRCSVPDLTVAPPAPDACSSSSAQGKTSHVMMPYSSASISWPTGSASSGPSLGKQRDHAGRTVYAGFRP